MRTGGSEEDPRCPACGEPIGITATYCMHCSADLTEEYTAADADGDGFRDRITRGEGAAADGSAAPGGMREPHESSGAPGSLRRLVDVFGTRQTSSGDEDASVLDPDGLVDNSLTVVVGVGGGLIVGIVGTGVLLILTGSGWAVLVGLVAWLAATGYLVRRRTVQAAVAHSGYAVAVVLFLVPLIAASPLVEVEGGIQGRGGLFVVLLLFAGVPATVAAGVGWLAAQFISTG